MHEHRLVQEALDEVLRAAAAGGAGQVNVVRVRLNRSSHVTPEQFREHFRLIAGGTPAEAATIEIQLVGDLEGELSVDTIDVEA